MNISQEDLGVTGAARLGSAVPSLKLADDLMWPVNTGRKTCTIRHGWRDIKPGPLVLESVSGKAGKLVVDVRRVTFKDFGQLTGDDAIAEGLKSRSELHEVMRRFYPGISGADPVTVIAWDPPTSVRKDAVPNSPVNSQPTEKE